MKKIYTLFVVVILTIVLSVDVLLAQTPQQVTVRDLNSYTSALNSQVDLRDHPFAVLVSAETPEDKYVTFDAVVVSYPKNSGLASVVAATGVPGRIHVFVTDVNAAELGGDGMSIQIVVDGPRRETLEALSRGDVIRVAGFLRFFNNVSQFDARDVTFLGSVQDDEEYQDLEDFLEPVVVPLTEVNQPSAEVPGRHRWVADNYSKYINRYVKFEGLEVIDVLENNTGRPRMVLSDGNTIIYMYDTSLRFRNDRGSGYAYNPTTDEGLGYNWRRLSQDLDGPFVPPAPGSIVDISGYLLIDTFDPLTLNEVAAQSALKIVPWDDGILWLEDGTDPEFRITEGWRNDLVVLGFAPLLDGLSLSPMVVTSDDEPTLTVTVTLPEADYTLNGVSITYTALGYNDETSSEVTAAMTANGNTFSFMFPAFDDFTNVSYTITATAQTPGGVVTNGRQSGSYSVVNPDVTSPPTLSPGSGAYENTVSVTMSSSTPDAAIYYTTDGSTPTSESTAYEGSAVTFDATTTVRAIAIAPGLDPSPVTSRTYTVTVAATPVSTLAELRAGSRDGTTYQYTGNAVVTYARATRNQKYLMDSSGGLLIDDAPGVITSPYAVGDVMSNVLVTLGAFNQQVQALPSANPGNPDSVADVVPIVTTLSDLNLNDHESALVTINNVRFVNRGTGTFAVNTNYTITDNSLDEGQTRVFRSSFAEADYIGQAVPEVPLNITALVNRFNATIQIVSRSSDDFNFDVSAERLDGADEFRLSQNYPNPFNPSTNIVYSVADVVNVNLVVYDILGRVVANLVNDVHTPGQYSVNFDASTLASGTYIYRLQAGDFVSTKKMMLIK